MVSPSEIQELERGHVSALQTHDNDSTSAQASTSQSDSRDHRIPDQAYVDGSHASTNDVSCQYQDAAGRQCFYPSTRSAIDRGVCRCGHHWKGLNESTRLPPAEANATEASPVVKAAALSADAGPVTFKEYDDPHVQWTKPHHEGLVSVEAQARQESRG